jgi:hypothetical protein
MASALALGNVFNVFCFLFNATGQGRHFRCTVPGLRHDSARDDMHPSRNDYDTVGSSWRGNPGRNKDG